jgi:hypothetical protein
MTVLEASNIYGFLKSMNSQETVKSIKPLTFVDISQSIAILVSKSNHFCGKFIFHALQKVIQKLVLSYWLHI